MSLRMNQSMKINCKKTIWRQYSKYIESNQTLFTLNEPPNRADILFNGGGGRVRMI